MAPWWSRNMTALPLSTFEGCNASQQDVRGPVPRILKMWSSRLNEDCEVQCRSGRQGCWGRHPRASWTMSSDTALLQVTRDRAYRWTHPAKRSISTGVNRSYRHHQWELVLTFSLHALEYRYSFKLCVIRYVLVSNAAIFVHYIFPRNVVFSRCSRFLWSDQSVELFNGVTSVFGQYFCLCTCITSVLATYDFVLWTYWHIEKNGRWNNAGQIQGADSQLVKEVPEQVFCSFSI